MASEWFFFTRRIASRAKCKYSDAPSYPHKRGIRIRESNGDVSHLRIVFWLPYRGLVVDFTRGRLARERPILATARSIWKIG